MSFTRNLRPEKGGKHGPLARVDLAGIPVPVKGSFQGPCRVQGLRFRVFRIKGVKVWRFYFGGSGLKACTV